MATTPCSADTTLSPAPSDSAPSVFLLPHLLRDSVAAAVLVPPPAVDNVYEFLKSVTGYAVLESWTFVLSRDDTSTLIAAVYCNEDGREEDELNVGASHILGVEVYGKAVLVCLEEGEGDEDGEGEYSSAVSVEALVRKLDERGEELPEYKEKIVDGRVGDLLHQIKLMLGAKHKR